MNDVAAAVNELETAISEVETGPRVSLSERQIREHGSATVLLMAGSASNLQDTSADTFLYFDSYSNGTGTISGYTLAENGSTDNYVSNLDPARIVAVESTNYEQWRGKLQWTKSPGKFAQVTPGYLPRDLRAKWDAQGINPPRYRTFIEVLTFDKVSDAVTMRIFSNQSTTPDAVEYGEYTVKTDELNASLMTAEQFKAKYALSKDVWPVGSYWTYEAQLYCITENKGSSATFQQADENTAEVTTAANTRLELTTEYVKYVVKAADNKEQYIGALPTEDVRAAIELLSRNTVTRALKHADSNNYCSETAVALTSAGHAMPEIRIKGTITIPVDFTSKEYMFLRRAFGMADETVSNLDAIIKDNYRAIAENSGNKLPVSNMPDGTIMDLKSEVLWKTPKLRPVN